MLRYDGHLCSGRQIFSALDRNPTDEEIGELMAETYNKDSITLPVAVTIGTANNPFSAPFAEMSVRSGHHQLSRVSRQ